MFDRTSALWRDDEPTPATPPARADQARPAPTPDGRPRQTADEDRGGGDAKRPAHEARERRPDRDTRRPREQAPPRTTGHRREHDAREPARHSSAERKRAAVADVAMYRAVSYTDLSARHFDGHPYAARRAVDQLVRDGHLHEHAASGPQGGTYTVLTATPDGARAAQRAAADAGHTPEQQTWTGLVKPAELAHDVAVYRAATEEQDRIEADGGRVTRVRIDAELKQIVARASEKARAEGGKATADQARAQAARDLDLPMHDGQVMYPDAQLDIEDRDGRTGRVNVEIASDHYHAAAIVAKAGAGFAMHGSSGRASQRIARALAREADRPGGGRGGGAQPGRDGSVEL